MFVCFFKNHLTAHILKVRFSSACFTIMLFFVQMLSSIHTGIVSFPQPRPYSTTLKPQNILQSTVADWKWTNPIYEHSTSSRVLSLILHLHVSLSTPVPSGFRQTPFSDRVKKLRICYAKKKLALIAEPGVNDWGHLGLVSDEEVRQTPSPTLNSQLTYPQLKKSELSFLFQNSWFESVQLMLTRFQHQKREN